MHRAPARWTIGLLAPWLATGSPPRTSLEELLARQARARGGEERAAAVQSLRAVLEIRQAGSLVSATYLADRLGRVRVDVSAGGRAVFAEGLDEHGVWRMQGGVLEEGSPDGMAALEHGRLLNLYGLEELSGLGHRLVFEGSETAASETFDVVRLDFSDGSRTWLGIDDATGRISFRRDYRPLHPDVDPRPRWVETRFSDFRSVGGVLFPFRESVVERETGRLLESSRVLELEVDPCIQDADIRRPQIPARAPVG